MARVKIKGKDSRLPSRKQKLLEVLSTNDIYVTKILLVNDGFIIFTLNDDELDKIFKTKQTKT